MKHTEKLRNIVLQAWVGMLLLLVIMLAVDLIQFGMQGDFTPLIKDPGTLGLWFIAVVSCISVLTQMFLRTYEARSCRWAFFYITVVYTTVFILHQLNHLLSGDGVDIHFLLDITHHVLGVWGSVAAYRWAKLGRASTAMA